LGPGDHLKTLYEYFPQMLYAFKKRNQRRLRKLNDYILRETAVDCNQVNFELAIVSYVLSKIVSKPRFLTKEFDECLYDIERSLEKIVRRMKRAEEKELLSLFKDVEKNIACLDKKDPRFVISLVMKGKLKMAATFYAQGMSLGVASEMTGIEKQEILDYAGQTMMFDRMKEEITIKERMKIARQLISE
jgi:hypothetical protein